MVQRQTYSRHVSWNTKSNKHRFLKTPGGRLTYQIVKKKASKPKCGDTGKPLAGIPTLRPHGYKTLRKRSRKVSRAYGGTLSAGAVRQRVVRAFLIEEQRCVKQVLMEKEKLKKEDEAPVQSKKKKDKK
ncbi:unnamed protein product [Amoebophrya sp. A25]|nr:unnamed protein product [Amoebophrya sp. A25]|eukprot:GSA25T00003962001.1